MRPNEERRQYPRLKARLPVEFRIRESTQRCKGVLHDLSVGGARILTDFPIPMHAILEDLDLPLGEGEDRAAVRATATVCRAERAPSEGGKRLFYSAVIFLGLRGEEFERVRKYVDAGLKSV